MTDDQLAGAETLDERVMKQTMARADIYAGQRLRERRQALGMTQQQVALKVGVTIQQVFKYENGVNRMTVGRLFELAQALDAPPDWFFERPNDEKGRLPFSARHKLSLEIARSFNLIGCAKKQESLVAMARAMAEP